jgi:hypothetical protein
LLDLPDFERGIECDDLSGIDVEAGGRVASEALRLDLQVVLAGIDSVEAVEPRLIRLCGARDVGAYVRQLDGGVRDHGFLRVGNEAGDRAAAGLRDGARRECECNGENTRVRTHGY